MDMPGGECFIQSLPTELLHRIFIAIDDPQTLCRAERTCHRWRSIINNSQSLWRTLATKLSSSRILPEKLNQLGKGSLIVGRFIPDENGDTGRWDYLYRDLVRNIHSFNRIPGADYREFCFQNSRETSAYLLLEKGPEIMDVISSMPELSALPEEYVDNTGAHVIRRIDFTSSAIEGMRLQNRPLLNSKTPSFTDSLCVGAREMEETSWIYFADQVTFWSRMLPDIEFRTPDPSQSQITIRKGIIRAGRDGIFPEGHWRFPEHLFQKVTKDKLPSDDVVNTEPKTLVDSLDLSREEQQSSTQKRTWKVFTTRAKSSASSSLSLPLHTPNPSGDPIANNSLKMEGEPDQTSKDPELAKSVLETAHPPAEVADRDKSLHHSVKWMAPIDSMQTLPQSRRWDNKQTIYDSFTRMFSLTSKEIASYQDAPGPATVLTNTLYGEMQNQAHSDPNLRIVYERRKGKFPEAVAVRVDRLALPPSKQIQRDFIHPREPVPTVNQSWNLFGEAKWSLNSVKFYNENEAAEAEGQDPYSRSADSSNPGPWWFHETFYRLGVEEDDDWETAHTWEYRSCGDYLIISDDVGMSGPSTISCFKTGFHLEKSTNDPKQYLRGAALRNYWAAGPSSDLVWQRSLQCSGYIFDRASSSAVHSLQDPQNPDSRPGYFLDNDGIALNSKVVVYATRKKVFYSLDSDSSLVEEPGRSLSCMEFHVISLENGQTINILDLEYEKRVIRTMETWDGWASFVVSDTHLMATVGGNVHPSQGAENESDVLARTWGENNRYGREEIFVWPLDVPDQNLKLPPDERKIFPTGRLGIGFNQHRWWRRTRFLALSRDGQFLAASSKYDLIVWDLWNTKTPPVHYNFDKTGKYIHCLTLPNYTSNANKFLEGGLKIAPDGHPLPTTDNMAYNGVWLQFRDVVIDPSKKSFTNSASSNEYELLRKVIFVPSSEIRMHLDGVDYEFQRTETGRGVANDLDRRALRRYHTGFHGDSSSESDDWETEDSDEDDDDDIDDNSDWDYEGGGPFLGYDDDDDDDDDYDDDYDDSIDEDEDDDEPPGEGVFGPSTTTRRLDLDDGYEEASGSAAPGNAGAAWENMADGMDALPSDWSSKPLDRDNEW
ncbi:hypothetical protein AA313_de0203522 [Arthrobotrys entomopaga]|nr:hypothetical protein AA313_de0203522 [Arthrobotrys entomopaga]